MKVIEQLIQHFHARGVLSATEIDYLLAAGYIRRHDLFGHPPADDEPVEPTPLYEPGDDDRLDRLGEEIELSGRRVGRRKGSKGKVKPTGHDLTPLAAVLATHLGDREPYPALVELGQRLTAGVRAKPGVRDWRAAATAVAAAASDDLETALVATLWRMGGTGLLALIPARTATPPNVADDGWLSVMDRPFKCPYDWTV